MKDQKTSLCSIEEASRSRVEFSGYRGSLGAAGHREINLNPDSSKFLTKPGDSLAISPGAQGFEHIVIGGAWDMARVPESNPFLKLFRKTRSLSVDLDLGCLYELTDGTRGCVQAFGGKLGALNAPPYIALSGDERKGDKPGHDETLMILGKHWHNIKRLLVYIYIYTGAPHWGAINPQVIIDVPGEHDLILTLGVIHDHLPICAIGGLENEHGGIKLTNYSEYFPGHAEMDRAFGFGLNWEDGQKN